MRYMDFVILQADQAATGRRVGVAYRAQAARKEKGGAQRVRSQNYQRPTELTVNQTLRDWRIQATAATVISSNSAKAAKNGVKPENDIEASRVERFTAVGSSGV